MYRSLQDATGDASKQKKSSNITPDVAQRSHAMRVGASAAAVQSTTTTTNSNSNPSSAGDHHHRHPRENSSRRKGSGKDGNVEVLSTSVWASSSAFRTPQQPVTSGAPPTSSSPRTATASTSSTVIVPPPAPTSIPIASGTCLSKIGIISPKRYTKRRAGAEAEEGTNETVPTTSRSTAADAKKSSASHHATVGSTSSAVYSSLAPSLAALAVLPLPINDRNKGQPSEKEMLSYLKQLHQQQMSEPPLILPNIHKKANGESTLTVNNRCHNGNNFVDGEVSQQQQRHLRFYNKAHDALSSLRLRTVPEFENFIQKYCDPFELKELGGALPTTTTTSTALITTTAPSALLLNQSDYGEEGDDDYDGDEGGRDPLPMLSSSAEAAGKSMVTTTTASHHHQQLSRKQQHERISTLAANYGKIIDELGMIHPSLSAILAKVKGFHREIVGLNQSIQQQAERYVSAADAKIHSEITQFTEPKLVQLMHDRRLMLKRIRDLEAENTQLKKARDEDLKKVQTDVRETLAKLQKEDALGSAQRLLTSRAFQTNIQLMARVYDLCKFIRLNGLNVPGEEEYYAEKRRKMGEVPSSTATENDSEEGITSTSSRAKKSSSSSSAAALVSAPNFDDRRSIYVSDQQILRDALEQDILFGKPDALVPSLVLDEDADADDDDDAEANENENRNGAGEGLGGVGDSSTSEERRRRRVAAAKNKQQHHHHQHPSQNRKNSDLTPAQQQSLAILNAFAVAKKRKKHQQKEEEEAQQQQQLLAKQQQQQKLKEKEKELKGLGKTGAAPDDGILPEVVTSFPPTSERHRNVGGQQFSSNNSRRFNQSSNYNTNGADPLDSIKNIVTFRKTTDEDDGLGGGGGNGTSAAAATPASIESDRIMMQRMLINAATESASTGKWLIAHHSAEIETLKTENSNLKDKISELQNMLAEYHNRGGGGGIYGSHASGNSAFSNNQKLLGDVLLKHQGGGFHFSGTAANAGGGLPPLSNEVSGFSFGGVGSSNATTAAAASSKVKSPTGNGISDFSVTSTPTHRPYTAAVTVPPPIDVQGSGFAMLRSAPASVANADLAAIAAAETAAAANVNNNTAVTTTTTINVVSASTPRSREKDLSVASVASTSTTAATSGAGGLVAVLPSSSSASGMMVATTTTGRAILPPPTTAVTTTPSTAVAMMAPLTMDSAVHYHQHQQQQRPLTPRPLLPFQLQTQLGVTLKTRPTSEIVAELSIVALNLKSELDDISQSRRKLLAHQNYIDSLAFPPSTLSGSESLVSADPAFIDTIPETDWPTVPHFLRTRITPNITNYFWSAGFTTAIVKRLFDNYGFYREMAAFRRDFKMVAPRLVQIHDRRKHVLQRLDVTADEVRNALNLNGSKNNRTTRLFGGGGGATTTHSSSVSSPTSTAFTAASLGYIPDNKVPPPTDGKGYDVIPFGYVVTTFFLHEMQETLLKHKLIPNGNRAQFVHHGDDVVVELELAKLCYNFWHAVRKYRFTEPMCDLFVQVSDGQIPREVYDHIKSAIAVLKWRIASQDQSTAKTAAPTTATTSGSSSNTTSSSTASSVGTVSLSQISSGVLSAMAEQPSNNWRQVLYAASHTFKEHNVSMHGKIPIDLLFAGEKVSSSSSSASTKFFAAGAGNSSTSSGGGTITEASTTFFVKAVQRMIINKYNDFYATIEALLLPYVRESTLVPGLSLIRVPDIIKMLKKYDAEYNNKEMGEELQYALMIETQLNQKEAAKRAGKADRELHMEHLEEKKKRKKEEEEQRQRQLRERRDNYDYTDDDSENDEGSVRRSRKAKGTAAANPPTSSVFTTAMDRIIAGQGAASKRLEELEYQRRLDEEKGPAPLHALSKYLVPVEGKGGEGMAPFVLTLPHQRLRVSGGSGAFNYSPSAAAAGTSVDPISEPQASSVLTSFGGANPYIPVNGFFLCSLAKVFVDVAGTLPRMNYSTHFRASAEVEAKEEEAKRKRAEEQERLLREREEEGEESGDSNSSPTANTIVLVVNKSQRNSSSAAAVSVATANRSHSNSSGPSPPSSPSGSSSAAAGGGGGGRRGTLAPQPPPPPPASGGGSVVTAPLSAPSEGQQKSGNASPQRLSVITNANSTAAASESPPTAATASSRAPLTTSAFAHSIHDHELVEWYAFVSNLRTYAGPIDPVATLLMQQQLANATQEPLQGADGGRFGGFGGVGAVKGSLSSTSIQLTPPTSSLQLQPPSSQHLQFLRLVPRRPFMCDLLFRPLSELESLASVHSKPISAAMLNAEMLAKQQQQTNKPQQPSQQRGGGGGAASGPSPRKAFVRSGGGGK